MTAPAASARRGPNWLALVSALVVAAAYARAIWFTPPEMLQGYAQKILYVHAPSAWVAFLSFGLTALAGAAWLFLKDPRLDRFAESSAEVGLVFMTAVLVTGPLWGKPIWGTWWTWDARLTLTLFLWFIFLGYLVLRGVVAEREVRARYSAVLGILGACLIPFIHLSVYLFRTLHPLPVVARTDGPQMPPVMLITFFGCFFAFTLLYVAFVRSRMALATERDLLDDASLGDG
jgi:heme exporter protein C